MLCVCVPPKSKAPTSFLERKKTKDAGFPRIETTCSHLLNSVLQKEKFYIIYQYTGLSLSNYTYVYNDLVRVASTSTFEHVFFLEAVQQQHVWTRHRTAELPACGTKQSVEIMQPLNKRRMKHHETTCDIGKSYVYIYIYTFLNLKKSLFCFKKMQAEPTANHKDNPASMPSSSICWSSLSHGRGHWANISHKAEANPLKGQRPRKQWCVCCFLSEFGIKHLDQLENSKFHSLLNFECIFTFATRFRQAFFATVQSTGVARIFFGDQGPKPRRGEIVAKLLGTPWVGCVQLNHGSPCWSSFFIHRFQVWSKNSQKNADFVYRRNIIRLMPQNV